MRVDAWLWPFPTIFEKLVVKGSRISHALGFMILFYVNSMYLFSCFLTLINQGQHIFNSNTLNCQLEHSSCLHIRISQYYLDNNTPLTKLCTLALIKYKIVNARVYIQKNNIHFSQQIENCLHSHHLLHLHSSPCYIE